MKIRFNCRNPERWRDEKGVYTLESALLLPVALALTAAAAFLAIACAQAALVYATAEQSADRVAANWNDSAKHPASGMFAQTSSESLYWRWNQDGGNAWLGTIGTVAAAEVALPSEVDSQERIAKKLSGASFGWPSAYRGKSAFRDGGWSRQVAVEAAVPLSAPVGFARTAAGASAETIVEPAETIRNFELLLGYLPALRLDFGVGQIRSTFAPWLDRANSAAAADRNLTFRHHAEAVRYTRTLVMGREARISTRKNGKWRLVDALDKQNVAHQTYIGSKHPNKDVLDQLAKDAELLQDGKVRGVVWHFYRRTGESASGPSAALRRMLQERGIVIVVHA
ncbi:hypothetical protein [Paenibacillus sp.]|uniref:hypothetical protein n=1 Tax=Paenibacillus sp. TaxID=58172 RepID=UPI002D3F20BD|nr:hypothetical protein [Paenibacillus sp.]HZG56025.1 hypothetical protein [Paenibacillus sp.]